MVDLALRVIASLGSGKTAAGLVGGLLLSETSVRTLAWTVAGARCEASVSSPVVALYIYSIYIYIYIYIL